MSTPYIIKKVEAKVNHAIFDHALVADGDRVMVGLSGGKDSYSLLDVLVSRRRCLPIRFELHACHVQAADMDYRADIGFMQRYCQQHGVPLHLRTIEVQYNPADRRPACFICSWKRRKALFTTTKEQGCNKLALGHHLDDTVETLLMNMLNHASISSIPPMLPMFGDEFRLIRPLTACLDAEMRRYATARQFPAEVKRCQYEHDTHRADIRELIHAMTRINRNARENMYRSTQHIMEQYIVRATETPTKARGAEKHQHEH
ncbi:MAG: tRNA 2-thiocytidine(32) synthetase TtcA [Bacteroidales bacterium]|nr:tRNA 2-thiocytidine(32) synthetase TtcA [Bacteroidales bacterium]